MSDSGDDTLRPSEATDSDELANADGDQVVDPPEDWQGADKFGMTGDEAVEGESLDDKLAAELPDVGEGAPPESGADGSLFRVVR